jgi:CHAD domain-containing protein
MYPLVARRALARRLEALSKNLPPALAGDVEGVHRSRVASRRLRELLVVLSPKKGDGDRKAWRALNTRVRAITRALGGVRELDVALELLDEIVAARPDLTPAVIASRAVVELARRGRSVQMSDELAPVGVEKLRGRLDALATVPGDGRHRRSTFGLRDRVEANAGRLEAAAATAGALFAMDRLHEVRIAAKKLRYALELVEELLGFGTKRATARLRAMQDLLGRMHDLGILAEYVRRAGAPRPAPVDVKGLLDVIEGEMHALHAGYLGRADALAAVVEESRGRLALRMDGAARGSDDNAATDE